MERHWEGNLTTKTTKRRIKMVTYTLLQYKSGFTTCQTLYRLEWMKLKINRLILMNIICYNCTPALFISNIRVNFENTRLWQIVISENTRSITKRTKKRNFKWLSDVIKGALIYLKAISFIRPIEFVIRSYHADDLYIYVVSDLFSS